MKSPHLSVLVLAGLAGLANAATLVQYLDGTAVNTAYNEAAGITGSSLSYESNDSFRTNFGGDPTDGSDDPGNTPTYDNSDPSNFIFTFKCRDAAAADANTDIAVEYGSNLSGWAEAVHGTDGVIIDDSTDLGGGFHEVTVSIPRTLATDGKLFARLKVTVTTTP